jgi:murein DD-endopeptidase MepM/ murein hydrolase activator NlpD
MVVLLTTAFTVTKPSLSSQCAHLLANESVALDPAVFDLDAEETGLEENEAVSETSQLVSGAAPGDINPWSNNGPTPQGKLEAQFEPLKKLLGFLNESRALLEFVPSVWPVKGSISSPFGWRTDPVTGARAMHFGVDIKANAGSPVVAAARGKVIFAGRNGSLGNTIIIHHGEGFATRYGHLQHIHVKRGDYVRKNEQVATVGSSGRSTGAHLHYEVHRDGVRTNPAPFMGKRQEKRVAHGQTRQPWLTNR